jgi:hypothetical protein
LLSGQVGEAAPRTEAIAELWLARALFSYPGKSAQFFAAERDPFRNPAGHTLRRALEILLDELCGAMTPARVTAALDSLMQVLAVQDAPPSRALAFLFQLKEILPGRFAPADLERLNSRIDGMALEAFDLFVKYRERTYLARAHEAQRRVHVLERRRGAV